jgi:hypothetical protein
MDVAGRATWRVTWRATWRAMWNGERKQAAAGMEDAMVRMRCAEHAVLHDMSGDIRVSKHGVMR